MNDNGLDVTFYQLEVSDENHINRIADQVCQTSQVESQFGQIDVLVNNAAILYDTWQNAETKLLELTYLDLGDLFRELDESSMCQVAQVHYIL